MYLCIRDILYIHDIHVHVYIHMYIHTYIYIYIYIWYTYSHRDISHMVTYKIYTFVHFNVDYHHQEHFCVREWNHSQFQNTRGGVKVMKFWIVRLLKTLIFGRSKHLKNSSKILANTFSDSLAILNFFNSRFPARSHNSDHNPHGFPSRSVPFFFFFFGMPPHS